MHTGIENLRPGFWETFIRQTKKDASGYPIRRAGFRERGEKTSSLAEMEEASVYSASPVFDSNTDKPRETKPGRKS